MKNTNESNEKVGKKTAIDKLKNLIDAKNTNLEENKKIADIYMNNLKKSSNLITESVLSSY